MNDISKDFVNTLIRQWRKGKKKVVLSPKKEIKRLSLPRITLKKVFHFIHEIVYIMTII